MTGSDQIRRVRTDLNAIFDYNEFPAITGSDLWQSLYDSRQTLIEAQGMQKDDQIPATAIGMITLEAAVMEVPLREGQPEICSRAEARFLYTLQDIVKGQLSSRKEHFIFIDPDEGVAAIQKGHVAESVLSLKQTPEFPSAPGAIYFGDSSNYHLATIGEEIASGIYVVPIGQTEFEFGRYSTFAVPIDESIGLQPSTAVVVIDDMETRIDDFTKAAQDLVGRCLIRRDTIQLMKSPKIRPADTHPVTRAFHAIKWFLRFSLLMAVIVSAILAAWEPMFMSILALVLSFIPEVIETTYKLTLPIEFDLVVVIIIYMSIFMGEIFDAYERFFWWDAVLHITSGVVLSFAALLILYVLYQQKKFQASPFIIAMLVFSFGVALGTVWEVFEFFMDGVFGLNMQRGSLSDTMWDMVVNMVGALAISFAGYRIIRSGRNGGIVSQAITSFYENNPKIKGADNG